MEVNTNNVKLTVWFPINGGKWYYVQKLKSPLLTTEWYAENYESLYWNVQWTLTLEMSLNKLILIRFSEIHDPRYWCADIRNSHHCLVHTPVNQTINRIFNLYWQIKWIFHLWMNNFLGNFTKSLTTRNMMLVTWTPRSMYHTHVTMVENQTEQVANLLLYMIRSILWSMLGTM